MLELLRSLEWCVEAHCPACGMSQYGIGHTSDCRLDRAIRGLAESAIEEVPEPSPPEPTVDEMAAEMGWTRAADLNRGEHSWIDPTTGAVRLSRRWGPDWDLRAEWSAFEDSRGWATDEMAIRTLYREHKARQADPPAATVDDFGGVHCPACHCVFGEVRIRNGKQAICPNCGRRVRMKEEPPTDPTALAAWLYARVVPGHTVVEWTEPSMERVRTRKAFISAVEAYEGHIVLWPHGDSALYVPPPSNHTHRPTKLVNPDGTVLWEAK